MFPQVHFSGLKLPNRTSLYHTVYEIEQIPSTGTTKVQHCAQYSGFQLNAVTILSEVFVPGTGPTVTVGTTTIHLSGLRRTITQKAYLGQPAKTVLYCNDPKYVESEIFKPFSTNNADLESLDDTVVTVSTKYTQLTMRFSVVRVWRHPVSTKPNTHTGDVGGCS